LPKRDAKAERLKALGVLNPSPQRVRASWFEAGGFFDARDLVQVKYEMLRHANREAAAKADAAFARDGLSGLLPRQRGPKGAHKLTPEVMAFIEQHLAGDGQMHARALAQRIEVELGVSVHPRCVERAIARKKKR
jgi:hypothetical protein